MAMTNQAKAEVYARIVGMHLEEGDVVTVYDAEDGLTPEDFIKETMFADEGDIDFKYTMIKRKYIVVVKGTHTVSTEFETKLIERGE